MQIELAFDEPELLRRDQPAMSDPYLTPRPCGKVRQVSTALDDLTMG